MKKGTRRIVMLQGRPLFCDYCEQSLWELVLYCEKGEDELLLRGKWKGYDKCYGLICCACLRYTHVYSKYNTDSAKPETATYTIVTPDDAAKEKRQELMKELDVNDRLILS